MKTENKTQVSAGRSRLYTYCPASAMRYARVLYELNIPGEEIEMTRKIFEETPQLRDVFINPTIKTNVKMNVIEQVFPDKMKNFLKVACKYRRMDLIMDIFAAYDEYCDKQKAVINAVLTCVEAPDEDQLEKMKKFLCDKYHMSDARIDIVYDKGLLGGFILRAGNDEYDWSLKGRLTRLEQKLTWR